MTRVVFENVSFSFNTPLLEDLSLTFDAGWSGIVGANGSGKTTLLRLITGDLTPESGRVQIVPRSRVAWCHQQSRDQHADLVRFAAETSSEAQRWRGLFALQPGDLERFDRLSSGERKRWQLARALAEAPDVLLLDEPTNHLDSAARRLLESALRHFEGVGILVSHDRALLDALTTRTLWLGSRGLEIYPGNYTASEAESRARRQATLHRKTELVREQRQVQHRARAQRQRAERAEADRSPRQRMKNPHDQDGRSILRKNQAESAGRRLAQDASALFSRLARVERELGGLHVEKTLGGEVFADYVPWPKPIVLRVEFEALYAGSRRLLGRVALDVGREDRVVVEGANGAGKSCFLRELERQNPYVFERSLYLPQSLPEGARLTLAERLRALPLLERGRVLNIVAALGSEPGAVLASHAWSPGETRKVALALGLAAHTPALILDEPENHFDLPSIERLERLLLTFPGCIVLVTHDAVLAEKLATRRLRLEAGELITPRP